MQTAYLAENRDTVGAIRFDNVSAASLLNGPYSRDKIPLCLNIAKFDAQLTEQSSYI